ncbi:HAD family acid phosphatase [Alteromonas sp. ASW11-36]|uniref:HAD family acid phosphatase n=1 Tax=Alteromonas arenosi TaxID=3055817 RepID=A0ABT7SWC1_9ALTE|nr:HAD family acid phosphatase [Alteromonas sp. ASW11-36]MDM7860445.1 HAD family acid phosphatase [Alteromonas sp. ASW11-36]
MPKHRFLKPLVAGVLSISAFGCQSVANAPVADVVAPVNIDSSLTFATWNVEHLAFPITEGCKPRTDAELEQLQIYASRLDADIIGLQEIGSAQAAQLLFPASDWQIIMSGRPDSDPYTCRQNGFTSTQQKVAYAVRKGLNVLSVDSLADFGLDSRGLRHGLEIVVETELGPVAVLNLHMKSGCFVDNYSRADSDSCKTFARQAPILDAWIESKESAGKPYVVLGDFNHRLSAPYNHLTRELTTNSNGSASTLSITTADIISCHPYYPAPIDHLLLGGVEHSALQTQVTVHPFDDMTVDNMLSDHCAITLSLDMQSLPLTSAVKWQTTSSEYQLLTRRTYRQAEQALATKSLPEGPWIVVLDVDETVLDNSQYQVELDQSGASYSPASWNDWVQREEATFVPGAADFIRAVYDRGGSVALVTNREQSLDANTWRNLKALGLDVNVNNTCLIGKVEEDESAINQTTILNDKDRRRQALSAGTASCYSPDGKRHSNFPATQIIMQIGDNIEDFTGVLQHSADIDLLLDNHSEEYFLLPNPMYGSW